MSCVTVAPTAQLLGLLLPSLDTLSEIDGWTDVGEQRLECHGGCLLVARRMAIEHFHLIGCPVPSCLPATTRIATRTHNTATSIYLAHQNTFSTARS